MLAPLLVAVAVGSWRRTYRRSRSGSRRDGDRVRCQDGVLWRLRRGDALADCRCGPMPFVVSFTAYFIGLHVAEALCSAAAVRGKCDAMTSPRSRVGLCLLHRCSLHCCCRTLHKSMRLKPATTPPKAARAAEVRRRQDDHRARVEQRARPSADPPADDCRHRLLGHQACVHAVAGGGLRVHRRHAHGARAI